MQMDICRTLADRLYAKWHESAGKGLSKGAWIR